MRWFIENRINQPNEPKQNERSKLDQTPVAKINVKSRRFGVPMTPLSRLRKNSAMRD